MRGAGGTQGGLGMFFISLIMMCAGFYLLFTSISVSSSFGFGMRLYSVGGFGITSGMVMFPFMFGVGILFYNGRNLLGWLLTLGSLVALIFGVIASIRFSFRGMTAFELITILVLAIGGLGMFLRSLRAFDDKQAEQESAETAKK